MCIQILSMLAADKLNILIKGHCNNLITAGIKLAAIKKVKLRKWHVVTRKRSC